MAEIKTKSNEEVHRQADEIVKPTNKEFVDKKFVDKELVNQTPVDEKEIQKDSLEDGISSLNENLLQNQAEATKNADTELLNILQGANINNVIISNEPIKHLEVRVPVKLEDNKKGNELVQV